jgi:hypothetical protein
MRGDLRRPQSVETVRATESQRRLVNGKCIQQIEYDARAFIQ